MKDSLRYVPVFGWAAQQFIFIFLTRKREDDIPHIKRAMSYLVHADKKAFILLFPEGTDLSASNLAKSRDFAKSKELREYKQVLYPKPGGFVTTIRCLKNQRLTLHDLTICYTGYNTIKRPTEKDILMGAFPTEVQILVRKHEIGKQILKYDSVSGFI